MSLAEFQSEIPGRIDKEELAEAADTHDWGDVNLHNMESDDAWSITYAVPVDNDVVDAVEIVIDSHSTVNGKPLNNVFIRGDTVIEIESYEDFTPIKEIVDDNEAVFGNIHIDDGSWEQLLASDNDVADEDNIVTEDVFDTITEKGITFGVTLEYMSSTENATITDLVSAVTVIAEGYNSLA